jgi:hypothetical protein
VYTYIAGGTDKINFSTFQDGHDEIAICEAVLQSHKSKSWVDVAY